MPTLRIEDRNLALEAVRVTERAAIASSVWMGRGDERSADQAAVDAMRQALNVLDIDGTVVIGAGERDEAPMLYIGERVGSGNGPKVDIALDPLEGTTITATGAPNAIACLAMAGAGGFLNAPGPTPTWTRSRSAAGCRRVWSNWPRAPPRICAIWPRPRASTSATSWC
jgi:fructose-1,6-bisphosphatase/sedoheptulose 1,7-bisphosphatase-like protein